MPVIGIDIGGTKIRAILWNGKRVIRAREVSTPKNKGEFQRRISALLSLLSRQKNVTGIGIGAAGIVNKTTFLFSPNIPYIKNFDFTSLRLPSRSLRVDNDARAFARAELLKGAGRGAKSLFALTIGTGIGRAYGRSGKIIKIKKFEYPERWEKKYQGIRSGRDDRELAIFLGEKLSPLLKPFKPDVTVIGGGVMERHGFFQRLEAAFKDHGLASQIRRARLRNNAVAIGAALLFHKK